MMFGMSYRANLQFEKLLAASRKGSFRSLDHAAASIRRSVISSIKKAPGPSPVGTPVHTREGLFKSSLFYHVSQSQLDAVIGLLYSRVAASGEPHEKGTFYKGYRYRPRPFMRPGLDKAAPRLAAHWSGSLG